MSRFSVMIAALGLAAGLVGGCAREKPQPTGPPVQQAPPTPVQPVTVCEEPSNPLKVFGIALGEPAEPLLKQLGTPTSKAADPKYGEVGYQYPKVSLSVTEGTGALQRIIAETGASLGEVLPGVRLGATLESVVKALDALAICVRDKSAPQFAIYRQGVLLQLEFENGLLVRVRHQPVGV